MKAFVHYVTFLAQQHKWQFQSSAKAKMIKIVTSE